MLAAPRLDPRLPRENLVETPIARHMCGNRKAPLYSDRCEHVVQSLVGQVRGWRYPIYSECAEVPTKLLLVGIGWIDTKYVDTFGGSEFKARKDGDVTTRGGAERLDATNVVVVCDGENRDSDIERLRDYGLGVRSGITLGWLPSKRRRIMMGVDLQRATTEHSTSGLDVAQVLSPSPLRRCTSSAHPTACSPSTRHQEGPHDVFDPTPNSTLRRPGRTTAQDVDGASSTAPNRWARSARPT